MKWSEVIKEHFNKEVPFLTYMGMEVVETSEGTAKIKIPLKKEYANTYGITHGGICALLVDTVIGVALRTLKMHVLTIETNTCYFKPAKLTDTLYATAWVVKKGNKILHSEAKIVNQDEELIGNGKAIYYVTGIDEEAQQYK